MASNAKSGRVVKENYFIHHLGQGVFFKFRVNSNIALNGQITFLDFRAQKKSGPPKKTFRIPIFADLRFAIKNDYRFRVLLKKVIFFEF